MYKHHNPLKTLCKTIKNQIPQVSHLEGRGRNPIPCYSNAIYSSTPRRHVDIDRNSRE